MSKETPESREISELRKKREALAETHDAIQRAREGDESGLPAVRAYLDERGPEYLEVLDLARLSQETQIQRIVGAEDLAAQEILRGKAGGLREEVAGPDPSPLERLLADRVVMCWLQLHYAEQKYAEVALQSVPSLDWEQEELHQKRIDRLQRRYIAAIKSLAQVRRLLGPNVQVNLAEQQMNFGGDLKR